MFPVGIINVCREMIPCGKRFIEGMLSGGFATLNRPAKFGFFLSEKLGMRGGRPSRRPYSYEARLGVMAGCLPAAPTATR